MDHGTLTDTNGKRADFRNVLLIMTSNVGAREMARQRLGFGGGLAVGEDDKAYRNLFSPEFRNRLDAKIGFLALSPDVMLKIVDKYTKELAEQLLVKNVTIQMTEAARAHFAEKGHDPRFGARPLVRVFQDELKRPLAEELLFGRLAKGGHVIVDVVNSKVEFRFELSPDPPTSHDLPDQGSGKENSCR